MSHVAMYLATLAVGYWVLTLAESQKNLTKQIGKIIAWVIIAVSVMGPLCIAGSRMKCYSDPSKCASMSDCPMKKGGSMMGGPGMMMDDKDKK